MLPARESGQLFCRQPLRDRSDDASFNAESRTVRRLLPCALARDVRSQPSS
jgi:hypothetical protein